MSDVTRILSQIEQGDATAADELLPLIYEELRKLAAAKLALEKAGQTLQATALVHEAYIRLVDEEKVQHWDSRWHFFAAAAEAMRRILVESARRKQGLKMQRSSETWKIFGNKQSRKESAPVVRICCSVPAVVRLDGWIENAKKRRFYLW
jgi:RNA polymerase sigma factor (TIGR02999 family)